MPQKLVTVWLVASMLSIRPHVLTPATAAAVASSAAVNRKPGCSQRRCRSGGLPAAYTVLCGRKEQSNKVSRAVGKAPQWQDAQGSGQCDSAAASTACHTRGRSCRCQPQRCCSAPAAVSWQGTVHAPMDREARASACGGCSIARTCVQQGRAGRGGWLHICWLHCCSRRMLNTYHAAAAAAAQLVLSLKPAL